MNEHSYTAWAPLIARIVISGIFIQSAILKIINYAGVVAFAGEVGLPAPELAIILAIVVELLGALSVLFGFKIAWGAGALLLFTLVASGVFHSNFADQTQMTLFVKNMGMAAALLYMMRFGAGKIAIDNKR